MSGRGQVLVLLCGIPSESPLAALRAALGKLGANYVVLNQREFAESELEVSFHAGELSGTLEIKGRPYRLQEIDAVFIRLMDDRFLPELDGEPESSEKRVRCRALHQLLLHWCELTTARIINRPSAMGSNNSKTLQAQMIRDAGFLVPETVVTSDPDAISDFFAQHRRVVYKSVSGDRSIVRELKPNEHAHLDDIKWCPTLFQEYVPGTDLRVHVIGKRVHATKITCSCVDYRYAGRTHEDRAVFTAVELPDSLAQRCVNMTASLGLSFCGIDLRTADDGRLVCFEVNPCPAFSVFEAASGQKISESVAEYLMKGA